MKIFRNSLPLLLLAALFSKTACQNYSSDAAANAGGGALPETIAIFQKMSAKPHRKSESRPMSPMAHRVR